MKRAFWLRAAVLAATAVLCASAWNDANDGTGEMRQVAPGVWFRLGENALGYCNNVVIEMQDYLIVVDANYPGGAREVIAQVPKLSPKPVKYVFDTHHHRDHSYGNALWTARGATTLAYKGVVDEMNRYEPTRWRQAATERQDVGDLGLSDAQRPQQTFEKSPFVLKDEAREVRFYYLGWGHTRGDGYVWLPKERILCTGDAAVNGPYNKLLDANMANWPRVLDQAAKFAPKYVLPGHGRAGGPEVLTGQQRFLVDLYDGVKAAIAHGKTLDQIHLTLPAADSNWVSARLLDQDVQVTYREITQHTPAGDIPHEWK